MGVNGRGVYQPGVAWGVEPHSLRMSLLDSMFGIGWFTEQRPWQWSQAYLDDEHGPLPASMAQNPSK